MAGVNPRPARLVAFGALPGAGSAIVPPTCLLEPAYTRHTHPGCQERSSDVDYSASIIEFENFTERVDEFCCRGCLVTVCADCRPRPLHPVTSSGSFGPVRQSPCVEINF